MAQEDHSHLHPPDTDEVPSEKHKDLVFCMDLAKQVLGRCNVSENIIEAADHLVSDSRSDVTALLQFIDRLSGEEEREATTPNRILVPAKRKTSVVKMSSDQGKYYGEVFKDKCLVSLTGNTETAVFTYNQETESVVIIRIDSISHVEYLTKKRRATFELPCDEIEVVDDGAGHSGNELFKLLRCHVKLDLTNRAQSTDPVTIESLSNQDITRDNRTLSLWEALISAEEELLPICKVTKGLKIHTQDSIDVEVAEVSGNEYYDGNLTVDSRSEVEVLHGREWIRLGYLQSKRHKNLTLQALPNRIDWTIKEGQMLRIEDTLSRSSRRKRQAALNDILEGRSVIRQIYDYFLGNINPKHFSKDSSRSVEIPSLTSSLLNSSQLDAIRGIYLSSNSISMVQGPPGTGKTFFTASLIGYILSQNPSARILISGQSNEAVNNCIEKVIDLFEELDSPLKVVRLGNEDQLTKKLLRFSEDEIQLLYLNDFESEFGARVAHACKQLPVPQNAIKDIIDLTRLVHEIISMKSSNPSGDEGNSNNEYKQRIGRLHEKFIRIMSTKYPGCFNVDTCMDHEIMGKQDYQLVIANTISNSLDLSNISAICTAFNIVFLAYEWCQSLRVSRNAFQEHLTSTRSIVCGTCVGIARNHYDMDGSMFDWVIIDEAGRASFPELCIPMRYGKRIVLIGDHKQLPPQLDNNIITHLETADGNFEGSQIRMSDFEKIISTSYGEHATFKLLDQYRMSGSIGDLCSEVFYEGQLVSRPGNLRAKALELLQDRICGCSPTERS
jgi:hypothetical protein